MRRTCICLAFVILCACAGSAAAQSPIHEAPPSAPSTGRVVPLGEPGQALHVSGLVVDSGGKPIAGASLYVYQTDHEGYYGVKPASDNRNPRLKVFLRSDAQGGVVVRHHQARSVPGRPGPGAHPLRSVGARPFAEGVRDRLRGRAVRHVDDADESGLLGAADRERARDGTDRPEIVPAAPSLRITRRSTAPSHAISIPSCPSSG